MRYDLAVDERYDGRSVGEVLRGEGFSRRLTASLKRVENGIRLNGAHARTVDICRGGDVITLEKEDEKLPEPNFDLSARILYEDERVIVFDKPHGMAVHESVKHRGDTLSNVFAAHCPGLSFRSVNRLDRDTCGCVICAKDAHAAKLLQKSYRKRYVGTVIGRLEAKSGVIDAPIARERESIIVRCVRDDGQRAVTEYDVIGEYEDYTLVRFNLLTGRTHQIRVHMASIGHPIAGDTLYGGECERFDVLQLCCEEVAFTLPDGLKISCRSGFSLKNNIFMPEKGNI